ncbi:MAG: hypothetical protein LR015_05360 [Verrucomicrobia bacterium]|nr:hypothetical protein [Verrucomicrobiota bacterium]
MMGIVLVPVIVAGRTFTDRQGNSIDAEVFAVYGSWVFLEIEPNVTLHFDLRNLVESDLEYVVQWAIDYEPTRINRPLVKDSESALTQFLRSNLVKLSGNRLVN